MSTDRVFESDAASSLRLTMPVGRIDVRVDPAATAVSVLLDTPATDGPAADAVQGAEWREQRATVFSKEKIAVLEVPAPNSGVVFGPGGSVSISGRGNIVIGSGNAVAVGDRSVACSGVMAYNAITNGSSVTITNGSVFTGSDTVTARVVMPPDGVLWVSTESGDVEVHGGAGRVEIATVSGNITVEQAAQLKAKTVSGGVYADRVTDTANIRTTSGEIVLDSYTGRGLLAASTAGLISVKVEEGATGYLTANTVAGNIRIRGAVGRVRTDLRSIAGKVSNQ